MRISDWSSDVCSSDLHQHLLERDSEARCGGDSHGRGEHDRGAPDFAMRDGNFERLAEPAWCGEGCVEIDCRQAEAQGSVHLGTGDTDGGRGPLLNCGVDQLEQTREISDSGGVAVGEAEDRKSTRMNSSH